MFKVSGFAKGHRTTGEAAKGQGKAHKGKGKNSTARRKIVVVLNILQDVFWKARAETARPNFFSLHSPGQVMRRANWATIQDRMRKWLLFTAAGPGTHRNTIGTNLTEAVATVDKKVVLFTRDALPANTCVVCREQREFQMQNAENRRNGNPRVTLSASIDCVHHQASLASLHKQDKYDFLVLGTRQLVIFLFIVGAG